MQKKKKILICYHNQPKNGVPTNQKTIFFGWLKTCILNSSPEKGPRTVFSKSLEKHTHKLLLQWEPSGVKRLGWEKGFPKIGPRNYFSQLA
jgi:hypothetical protein